MSLLDVIFSRRSVRRYKSDPMPEEVMKNILEAGRLAPSATNAQPWHFVVVTDPEKKRALSQGRYNWLIKDSAFTIVGCGEKRSRWSTIDVTIALENMVLAAGAQGVGSCWVGDFKQDEVKKLLGIPDTLRVICLVAFGYPAEKPSLRSKKSLEEIVHYNRF
ncbi:MAG: nitroreductase family protein [Candidatus Bathyarchaeota archaeon]|nr:nitroreductase family protein [Candidatus Bathyarchaeota archaeon]